MSDVVKKGGKKNRKIGRKAKKPAQKRYTVEKRWALNKAKSIVKQMRKHPNWKIPDNIGLDVKTKVRELIG